MLLLKIVFYSYHCIHYCFHALTSDLSKRGVPMWNEIHAQLTRTEFIKKKKKSNTKTCGAFLTIWEFWFALFYNKLLRCSRCLSPKSASEKNPTTSNTKKALYLVRTGHILLLDMKPAEGCCGPLTSLANIVWKSLVWATDPALHQSV